MAKIMFSGRFDGGVKEKYLRQTAAELGGLGFESLVVEAGAGDSYGPQTMEYLYRSDIVVAMVCDKYGELTKSPYCSYAEVRYFIDKKKRVIPIQLYNGEWPPEPEPSGAYQNHFFFTGDRVKVMAINENGELMSAKALAEQISQIVRKMPAKEPITPTTANMEDHSCHRARTEGFARQKEQEEEQRLRRRAQTIELDRKKEEQRRRKEGEVAPQRRVEDEMGDVSPQGSGARAAGGRARSESWDRGALEEAPQSEAEAPPSRWFPFPTLRPMEILQESAAATKRFQVLVAKMLNGLRWRRSTASCRVVPVKEEAQEEEEAERLTEAKAEEDALAEEEEEEEEEEEPHVPCRVIEVGCRSACHKGR